MALRPNNPQSRLVANTDAQQDVFVREVDDAVRQDQLAEAAKRHARTVGIAIAAGLAALAGYLWYDSHKASLADRQAEQFTTALDQVEAGQLDGGKAKVASLVSEGNPGYKAATQVLNAGIAAQQGKTDVAAKGFEAVAADATAPQPYRDLANVRLVALHFDTMKPEEVIAKLKPLAIPGNAFFPSAGELVGLAYMKQGHNDLAGPLFAAIAKDKDTPESMRSRVRQLAGLLGVDTVDDARKAAIDATPQGAAPAQPAAAAPQPAPAQ